MADLLFTKYLRKETAKFLFLLSTESVSRELDEFYRKLDSFRRVAEQFIEKFNENLKYSIFIYLQCIIIFNN